MRMDSYEILKMDYRVCNNLMTLTGMLFDFSNSNFGLNIVGLMTKMHIANKYGYFIYNLFAIQSSTGLPGLTRLFCQNFSNSIRTFLLIYFISFPFRFRISMPASLSGFNFIIKIPGILALQQRIYL